MELNEGYVYHISDDFFNKVKDDKLMSNKEDGNFRPTYYCIKDDITNLIWVVPMSSKVAKYQILYDKNVKKYGECLTIVIGYFDGKDAAFLLQNMFPIIESYLHHVHTKRGNPVPVHSTVQKIIGTNMKRLKILISKNKKVVFTDVKRIEKLMLQELVHNLE